MATLSSVLRRLLPLIALQLPTMFHTRIGRKPGLGASLRKGFLFLCPLLCTFFSVGSFKSKLLCLGSLQCKNGTKEQSKQVKTPPFYCFPTKAEGLSPPTSHLQSQSASTIPTDCRVNFLRIYLLSHPTWNRWRPIEQSGHRNRRRTFAHRFRQFYDLVVCHLDCRTPIYAAVSTPSRSRQMKTLPEVTGGKGKSIKRKLSIFSAFLLVVGWCQLLPQAICYPLLHCRTCRIIRDFTGKNNVET